MGAGVLVRTGVGVFVCIGACMGTCAGAFVRTGVGVFVCIGACMGVGAFV